MKAILTLATLLSMATPSMASLSGSYNTQATAERQHRAQCKVYHQKAQYESYLQRGFDYNKHYFVKRDGSVIKTDPFVLNTSQVDCEVVGYINQTTRCMGPFCKGIKSIEWAREGNELIRYHTNIDGHSNGGKIYRENIAVAR